MSPLIVTALVAVGLVVGVLIGCIGIGGVLLVPALTYIGGIEIHVAIASAMLSYLFSGAVGAVSFARRGSIRWRQAGWLCAGAMPGAFAGAALVHTVPAYLLEILLATLIIGAGLDAMRSRRDAVGVAADPNITDTKLAFIGVVVGIGSSMSGTGGPLVLIPILLWLGTPVRTAVGLSQVIQLPVAALATVGNVTYGTINLPIALATACLLMIGVSVGARIAHSVSTALMKRIVSVALLGVGVLLVARLAVG